MHWPWKKAETDLDRELAFHLETLADAYERQGMPRKEAMRRARAEFGGVEKIKDDCRDESRWNWLAQAMLDLRFGWRMMRKTPVTTGAAILSLALGIGATTAILTLADAVLWRQVGVPDAEYLSEALWVSKGRSDGLHRAASGSSYREGSLSVRDFFSNNAWITMRSRAAGKADVAAHIGSSMVSASFQGKVIVARHRGVSGNFFSMLRLAPVQGRLLMDQDDRAGATPVAVVTHRFAERHLGGATAAVNQTLRVNNTAYVLTGVLPAEFTGIVPGEDTDIYTPIQQSADMLGAESWMRKEFFNPTTWCLQILTRRAPGTSETELHTILDTAFRTSWEGTPPKAKEAEPHIRVSSAMQGLGGVRRGFGNPILILLSLVAMVLLVACANIANLLLARAVEREKEAALRVSLGCSANRLVRQFFTESLMLAFFGGVLSLVVAWALSHLMLQVLPEGDDGWALTLDLNLRSLAGSAAIALFTAMLFGLYPAFRTARVNVSPALKEGSGAGGTSSRARWAPAKMLVMAQVAMGVLLVTSAIVFTSHLNDLATRDTGFERQRAILFGLRPGEVGYGDERLRQFYFALEEKLGSLAGVEAVGISQTRPMAGGGYWDGAKLPGQAKPVDVAVHHGNARFLDALALPVIAGRGFTDQEIRLGTPVAIVGEDLARELGVPGGAAVGLRVLVSEKPYQIVGVAKRAQYAVMDDRPAVLYLPFDYSKRTSATITLRTKAAPQLLLGAIREAVKSLDANLPLVDVYTLEQQISRTLQRERLFAWLCGSFGVLALVLCVVGLYGLLSHTTARRTSEIGIRIALGATRETVMRQVLREGLGLAVAGFAVGVPIAWWAVRFAGTQKILPEGNLPYWTLAAAIGVLAVSALVAVLAPALRASSVDPMQALRRG